MSGGVVAALTDRARGVPQLEREVSNRTTHHDGGCMSAREFMQAGRRAIVTSELPFARRVRPDDLNLGLVVR